MRGKVDVQTEDGTPDRITPAYAGKRLRSTDFSDVDKDHPRLCGEKIFLCFVIMALIGSPPPMRGKDQAFQPLYMQHRITPAYAGKRPQNANARVRYEDHPRLCGEKIREKRQRVDRVGSPPPMRGKDFLLPRRAGLVRITPAYAGKSSSVFW